jgi:hypothetical protein
VTEYLFFENLGERVVDRVHKLEEEEVVTCLQCVRLFSTGAPTVPWSTTVKASYQNFATSCSVQEVNDNRVQNPMSRRTKAKMDTDFISYYQHPLK